jgi:hypothetical protein
MRKYMMAAAAAAALVTTPAMAQLQGGGGLVVVNIANVANNIARDLDINVSNVPVTVQVPVSVAAAVCNLDVNVLARQERQDGRRTCTAESTNDALNQVVQRAITRQSR